jgi:septum formation protein
VIYLASRSPRRRELLHQIRVAFETLDVEILERRRPGESAPGYATRMAVEKAEAGLKARPDGDFTPVLGADTIVVVGQEVLGKPGGQAEARSMLRRLSGRRHRVLSAVALAGVGETRHRLSETEVTFRILNDREVAAYCATAEPLDKAGAYAIQGLASVFVERIEGSFSGVVGLPLAETALLLDEGGTSVLANWGESL